jgi:hypothetical protein
MWSAHEEQQKDGCALKVGIHLGSSPVLFSEVLRLWQDDAAFRAFYVALLAGAPFSAFRWETPPITAATAHRPFEFVLLDSPGVSWRPDPCGFAAHFDHTEATETAVSFPNRGNDAIHVRLDDQPKYYGYGPYRTLG